jgi:hypothetical protein
VDERLHRREIERSAEPPTTAQKTMIGHRLWVNTHRECAHGVEQQADDIGALASEEVTELAAEDEGG